MSSLGRMTGWNPPVVSGFVRGTTSYQLLDIFESIITSLNIVKLTVTASRGREPQPALFHERLASAQNLVINRTDAGTQRLRV
jgi:hypothetical protein